VSATNFRQDLLDAGIGNGQHAFSLATPTAFKDGLTHTIRVKYGNTAQDIYNSPRLINCVAEAPPSNTLPSVNLTSPANNATYTAPATINLTATASDSDGSIAKVEFFQGTTLLSTDTNGGDGYTFTWANVPQGSYGLTAKATDNLGATASSGIATITVNGAISGNALLNWSFDSGTAVDSSPNGNHGSLIGAPSATPGRVGQALNFNGFNDGVNLNTVNTLATGNTPHTIAAWVKINSLPSNRAWLLLLGQEGTGSHHWLINNNGLAQLGAWNGNQVQPTLSAGVWQHVAITFDGTNLTGYINGTNIGTTPTSFNLQGLPLTLASSHIGENYFNGTVDELKIYDRALSAVEVSALASITPPPANTPPTVNLTSPLNNASYPAPATINLTASASDSDGSIAKVEFFQGTTLLGTDANGADGYSYSWSSVPQGSYSLTAKATDNLGAVTTSASIAISVTPTSATPINVALAGNGGLTSASSTYSSSFAHEGANDGDRTGANWGAGGGWNDATLNQYPDWLSVAFNGPKTINEIDVITVSDDSPAQPTLTTIFSNGGITDYDVQTWNGTSWVTIPNGTVSANNKTWRQFSFSPITTDKIRVVVNNALNLNTPYLYSRILEVEAWTGSAAPANNAPSVNLTSPTNNANYTAPATINLTASANDTDGTIAKVEFFNGTTLIATDTNGADGYSFTWTNVPQGSYALTTKATDNLGAVTTSTTVNVTVNPASSPTGQLYYIYADHLGSPRVITDATNQARWRWDNSDPFGANAPNEDPDQDGVKFTYNLRFAGQYYDQETGLHQNYFRDYDAGVGRYVESDPIGLRGGINTFAYVSNSPLRWSDPFGLAGNGGGFSTRYGNWCGKNWSGGRQGPIIPQNPAGPIDSVDECCMAHDRCYAKYECDPCASSSNTKDGKKECDRVLVGCLDALQGMPPQNWPKPPRREDEADAYFFCQKAKFYFK